MVTHRTDELIDKARGVNGFLMIERAGPSRAIDSALFERTHQPYGTRAIEPDPCVQRLASHGPGRRAVLPPTGRHRQTN